MIKSSARKEPAKSLKFYLRELSTFWRLRRFGRFSDPIYDLGLRANAEYRNLDRSAAQLPIQKVLIAAVEVPARSAALDRVFTAFSQTRHDVSFLRAPLGARGKFDNINAALEGVSLDGIDWFIVADDDIELPPNFLDRFLYICEKKKLVLSQPAHRVNSYKIWRITRRTWRNLVRTTHFVEIGPLTAFHRSLLADVMPFPESRYSWGLDFLWSEAAEKRDLSIGIVDATPIRHTRPVAGSYDWFAAQAESFRLMKSFGITRNEGDYMVTTAEYRTLE